MARKRTVAKARPASSPQARSDKAAPQRVAAQQREIEAANPSGAGGLFPLPSSRIWQPLALAALVLTAVFLARPFFTRQMLMDHDFPVQLARMIYADNAASQGLWSWRWLPAMARGYGYPIFNFCSPGAVYAEVILKKLSGSLVFARNSAGLIFVLAGAAGMWIWCRNRWGNWGALAAAVFYAFAPYTFVNLFVRGNLSELMALAIAPWFFWATECAVLRRNLPWTLCGGLLFAALIVSHNITAMVFGALSGMYFVLLSIEQRQWHSTLISAATGLLGICYSAFFILPIIAEIRYISIERDFQGSLHYSNHFVYFRQFFSRYWDWGYSVTGPNDHMSFQVGWVHVGVVLLAAGMLAWQRFRRLSPARDVAQDSSRFGVSPRQNTWFAAYWIIVTFTVVFLMMFASEPIWKLVSPLQTLQFPWRLLGVVTFAASALAASLVSQLPMRHQAFTTAGLVLLCLVTYAPFCKARYVRPDLENSYSQLKFLQSFSKQVVTTTAVRNEYCPKTVESYPAKPAGSEWMADNSVQILEPQHRANVFTATITTPKPAAVTLAQFNFPGWRAAVDGQTTEIVTTKPAGLMQIGVPPGTHALRIWFGSTPARLAGDLVSLVSLLLSAVLLAGSAAWRKRRRRLLAVCTAS